MQCHVDCIGEEYRVVGESSTESQLTSTAMRARSWWLRTGTKLRKLTSGPDVDSVYVLNEPDHQCYDIAHVLAPITLTSTAVQGADGSESFVYVLSKIDRDALDAAIAEIAKSELPRGSASGTSAKRKRSQMMADEGRETRTTTSTRGRVITAVQYNT
jgi:hypothetical protein